MTKHFLKQDNLTIDAGWDRPMHHFYLNVTRNDVPEDHEDRQVYISMYDKSTYLKERGCLYGGLSLDELKAKFTELNLVAPDGFFEALNDDARRNVGNAVTRWENGHPVRVM